MTSLATSSCSLTDCWCGWVEDWKTLATEHREMVVNGSSGGGTIYPSETCPSSTSSSCPSSERGMFFLAMYSMWVERMEGVQGERLRGRIEENGDDDDAGNNVYVAHVCLMIIHNAINHIRASPPPPSLQEIAVDIPLTDIPISHRSSVIALLMMMTSVSSLGIVGDEQQNQLTLTVRSASDAEKVHQKLVW